MPSASRITACRGRTHADGRRDLQLARSARWDFDGDASFIVFDPGAIEQKRWFAAALGLDPDAERFNVVHRRNAGARDQVEVRTRSLLGVMYFLSLSVQIPSQHQAAGFVTRTRDAAGVEFDWRKVLDPLMQVRSAPGAPPHAAVKVFYGGNWFWIADDDLNSKATFSLLRLLVFLKSGEQQATSPLVTIPSR